MLAEFVSITTSGALNENEDEKRVTTEEKADSHQQSSAVHSHARTSTTAPSTTSTSATSTPQPASARHRTQIGMHSAPFDEDEVQAIMRDEQQHSTAARVSAVPAVDEYGDVVEDEALMASSDGDAVAVVGDKVAYYENKNNLDDQNCTVM